MRRNALLALLAAGALVGLAACGSVSAPPAGSGKGASIAVSLKVVPTIRSVTISPAKAKFGDCHGGYAYLNTASTPGALGYPNGHCWLGSPKTSFPITITNTGIASYMYVNGANAVPSDSGTEWSLCNPGSKPAVTCTSNNGLSPGKNQYVVQNFSPNRKLNAAGLTNTVACDPEFGLTSGCWSTYGQSQREGLLLTGPAEIDDTSTSWTVTITWTPVP
jgi:hypothetical protein